MTCRQCGTTIADKAIVCYRCGRPTAEVRVAPGRKASSRTMRIAAVLLVAALAGLIWWLAWR